MNQTYVAENRVERQRLFKRTANLTEKDLRRQLPNGWSVATKLAHLAFWDRYCLSLILGWERADFTAFPTSADAINEAVRDLSGAIPPMAVVQLVRDAAEAIDRKVEEMTPQLATAIETGGHPRILRRALHRREHLDQIEKALGLAPNAP